MSVKMFYNQTMILDSLIPMHIAKVTNKINWESTKQDEIFTGIKPTILEKYLHSSGVLRGCASEPIM